MKKLFISLILVALLTGCGGGPTSTTGTGTATIPTPTPVLPTVHLKGSNLGNISHIDFQVVLPAGTNDNLLVYSGEATIKGTLQSSVWPCMKSPRSFSCKAGFSGTGNISVSNCSAGSHSVSMLIAILRGQKLKESYSVISIQANVSPSCYGLLR